VKSWPAALLLLLPGLLAAASLHEQPAGSGVAGSFDLGARRIYAPPAEWTLVASHRWAGTTDRVLQGPNFAGVYLAEVKDARLARALLASGNVDTPGRRWAASVDPCKQREQVIAYRDLSQNIDNQFCFDVSASKGYMPRDAAWRKAIQQWLAERQVKLPPAVLVVRFAKISRGALAEVYYYFDPVELGPGPQAAQAQAALKWAESVAAEVRAGLERW
jgi:hypothetical protein